MPDPDRASRVFFLRNKKGKAKTLDPRVRKDDGLFCHARLDRASRGFFLRNKKGKTKTLDPRMRKDDREKRKDDRLFLSCPTPIGHPGVFFFGIRREKAKTLDPRVRKDDGEKMQG